MNPELAPLTSGETAAVKQDDWNSAAALFPRQPVAVGDEREVLFDQIAQKASSSPHSHHRHSILTCVIARLPELPD